jgi:serine/threonine protein kinase
LSDGTVTLFGKYELLERLGAGGMAIVYRARYTAAPGITKPVVIKRVLGHFAEDPAFVQMFIHEARLSMGLNHGNIVQVFDFGQVEGEYFLAMELVDGQPLSRVLKAAQAMGLAQLPAPLAVSIAIEMCKGLHYAHTRTDERGQPLGVVHRDISPDNVLVSYEGEVKISDFGIAKAELVGRPVTASGVVKGKFLYLSPEQARGAKGLDGLDARSDVYAVGVVLYRMLCGRLPVEGPELAVLQRIVQGQLTSPLELNSELDPGLVRILHDALATDRALRTPSAEALHQQLSQWVSARAPLFSVSTLKHLMGLLFEQELTSLGRPPRLPPKFRDEMSLWVGNQGRPLQRTHTPARTRAVTPTRGSVLAMQAPMTAALPEKTEELPPVGRAPMDKTDELPRMDKTDELAPVADTARQQAYEDTDVMDAESEAPVIRSPLRIRHFWLWIAGVASLTALGVKLAMSYLLHVPPLEIHSDPSGALVKVDGFVRGRTPLTVEGISRDEAHTLEMTLPGMPAWTHTYEAGTLGEQVSINLVLPAQKASQALSPPPPTSPSTPDPAAPATQPPPSPPADPAVDTFASRQGTETIPARFTLQEKWHSFSATARSLRHPLVPRRTYKVWTSGSYTADTPVSEQDLRQGKSPTSIRSTKVYLFLEGEAVPSENRLLMVTSKPRILTEAQALHAFVLVGGSPERVASQNLTLHVRDETARKVVKLPLDARRFASQVAMESRYSIQQLDPELTYTMAIRSRERTPESAVAVFAVPPAGEQARVAGPPSADPRYVLGPGRYTLSGVRQLWCALPRWERDGEVEMQVTLDVVTPDSVETSEPTAPLDSDEPPAP